MSWDQRFLDALKASRPAYDARPDWKAALALYEGLTESESHTLDVALLAMMTEDYRNPHATREDLPFDDVMVNLPAGMTADDLLCLESAILVAAERGLGQALFAFNRLMRSPRWHALFPRLEWLGTEAAAVQRKLYATDAGRFLGALLGLAAGDALGVTVEFMDRQAIRGRYPQGHREILGGGPFGFKPGEWSDDTAMTLAAGLGIAEAPHAPVDAVGRHFMAWYEGHPPDVGNTCRLALEAYGSTGSWEKASRHVEAQLGDRSAGNGALMRTLPAALVYGPSLDKPLAIARMTHPHPDSDAAIGVYQRMVDALIRRAASKADAWEEGLSAAGHLRDRLARTAQLQEYQIRSSGYVVDTLEAAVWSFLTTDTLEACLVRAVNLGDDTDTVAAVAGGLAGAAYGPGALPRRWTAALLRREELENLAERLYAVRMA